LLQIAIDNDNNLYTISINTKPVLATNIIKLDDNGNIIWKKSINVDKKNFPKKIIINEGTIYILGKYITTYDINIVKKAEIKTEVKQINIRNIVSTKDKALLILGGKSNMQVSNTSYITKVK